MQQVEESKSSLGSTAAILVYVSFLCSRLPLLFRGCSNSPVVGHLGVSPSVIHDISARVLEAKSVLGPNCLLWVQV